MKNPCVHTYCKICGGIKSRRIAGNLTDICHPKCQSASGNICECKCRGKHHQGRNGSSLNLYLRKNKISGMTPAQKKNIERFKKAAAEAKKLRAKNPKLTQAQAMKKAFALLYKNVKIAAVKSSKTPKKTISKSRSVSNKSGNDSKSHNVNIRVISGIDKLYDDAVKRRQYIVDVIAKNMKFIEQYKKDIKKMDPEWAKRIKLVMDELVSRNAAFKKELTIYDKIVNEKIKHR